MAEIVAVKTQIDIGESAKSLKDLKAEFKELQGELSKTVAGSKEYHEVLKKIGNTKDEIDDLNDAINATTGGGKLQSFAKLGSSIAGGFASAQGAMALFGSESQELEKTLLKVQSAMALSQGLSELEGIGDALSNAKNAAKALFQTLLANPIMAIAAAVSAAVIAFGMWSEKMREQNDPLRTLKGAVDSLTKSNKELNDSYDIQITALQGLKANEEKILELQKRKLENNIAVARANKLLADAELQRAQEQEKSLTKEKTFLQKTLEVVTTLGQLNSVSTEKIKENSKAKQENAKVTENELLKAEAELAALTNVEIQKKIDKQKEYNEKHKEEIEHKRILKILNSEDSNMELLNINNAVQAIKEKNEEIQKTIKLTKEQTLEIELQTLKEQLQSEQSTMAKIGILARIAEIEKGIYDEKKKRDEADHADDMKNWGEKLATAEMFYNTINSLNSAFNEIQTNRLKEGEKLTLEQQKRQFQRMKALALVGAAIDGAKAITSILAQYPKFDGGFAMIAAIAAASATTVAQIAAISSKKFNPEGGGSGGGSISIPSGGAGTGAPILNNTPQNTTTQINQESGTVQGQGNKSVVKTYVVSSDVTAQQEVEKKIINKNKVE